MDDVALAAMLATAGDCAMTNKATKFLNEVKAYPGGPRTYRHSSSQGEIIWESIWIFLEDKNRFKHKTCDGKLTSEFEEVSHAEAIEIVARDFGVIHGLLTG